MQTDRSRLEHLRNDREPWRPRPTLGGDDYTSMEVYQQEREKIWWGDWVCAGRAEEVAGTGDYIVRDIAGRQTSSAPPPTTQEQRDAAFLREVDRKMDAAWKSQQAGAES